MPRDYLINSGSGNTIITNTTPSTSTTTGALVVNGGVGIMGNLYVSQNIICRSITPTGSIVAFLGTTGDPTGWVIANGVVRTNNDDYRYNGLNSMGIGTGGSGTNNYTPPNYQGAFLRGIGTNGVYVGPNIGTSQNHATQTHSHGVSQTAHSHSLMISRTSGYSDAYGGGAYFNKVADRYPAGDFIPSTTIDITINNSTLNVDANETRPFNFGVNWIIKL